MRKLLLSFLLALPLCAQAYSGPELQADCLAAEALLMDAQGEKAPSLQSARCLNYLTGFAEGYGIAAHLAGQVGVQINAFCPPKGESERGRLVRAVLAYLDRQPPFPREPVIPAERVVAAAFSKAFVCKE